MSAVQLFFVSAFILRILQTFVLRWMPFSVLTFILSEMFSEEAVMFSKIALSATALSLRELFRRIKTPSKIIPAAKRWERYSIPKIFFCSSHKTGKGCLHFSPPRFATTFRRIITNHNHRRCRWLWFWKNWKFATYKPTVSRNFFSISKPSSAQSSSCSG